MFDPIKLDTNMMKFLRQPAFALDVDAITQIKYVKFWNTLLSPMMQTDPEYMTVTIHLTPEIQELFGTETDVIKYQDLRGYLMKFVGQQV